MTMDKIKLVQGTKGMELPLDTGNWVMLREEGYSPEIGRASCRERV